MTTHRVLAFTTILLAAAIACEKASEPPPETPPGPSAVPATPDPAATTPVATPEPSAAIAPEAPAEPAPTSAATEAKPAAAAESAAPTKEAAHHGAVATKAPGAAESAPAASPAVEDPCQTKNFHFTQIAGACHSGGRKAAKGVMKGVVQKAKAAGTSLTCTSCHEDTKDFHLKSNAVGDLKNFL